MMTMAAATAKATTSSAVTRLGVVAIGSIGYSLHWLLHFAIAAFLGGLVGSLNPLQLVGL